MAIFSYNLPLLSEVKEMGGLPIAMKVSPALLIVTYLILTVAELFIIAGAFLRVKSSSAPYAGVNARRMVDSHGCR